MTIFATLKELCSQTIIFDDFALIGGNMSIIEPEIEFVDRTTRASAIWNLGDRQSCAAGTVAECELHLVVVTRLEIARLYERLGSTMIYVTHDQVEAMTLDDKIVDFRGGYIEQVGSPITLYEKPDNAFVAQFIGSPQMSFFNTDDLKDASLVNAGEKLGLRPEHMITVNGAECIAKLAKPPSVAKGRVIALKANPALLHPSTSRQASAGSNQTLALCPFRI